MTFIKRAFIDCAYFLIIMVLLLVYACIAINFLHLYADPQERESHTILPVFDSSLFDWNLSTLCYILFLLTMIISQITLFSMLISITSDTFRRVIEQRPAILLKNKLVSLAAMKSIIATNEVEKADDSKVFLYVIMPQIRDPEAGKY